MENTTISSTDPATSASEAAFTTSTSQTIVGGQMPADAGAALPTEETAIQPIAAENPPTVVRATAIVPRGREVALPAARGLSERKVMALRVLAAGAGPTAAAQAAGVSPMTVFRWRKYDPKFTAALNTWQAESRKTAREALTAANEFAAQTVLAAVQKGDVRAALAVLKGMGTLSPMKEGPEFATLVEKELKADAERKRHGMGIYPELRRERRRRHLFEKNHPEEAATKVQMQEAKWQRFSSGYLQLPPLSRPITRAAMGEAVKRHAAVMKLYATRCSFAICQDVSKDPSLARYLAEQQDMTVEQARQRLTALPWLLNLVIPTDKCEAYALELEALGARVELRPSWVE